MALVRSHPGDEHGGRRLAGGLGAQPARLVRALWRGSESVRCLVGPCGRSLGTTIAGVRVCGPTERKVRLSQESIKKLQIQLGKL